MLHQVTRSSAPAPSSRHKQKINDDGSTRQIFQGTVAEENWDLNLINPSVLVREESDQHIVDNEVDEMGEMQAWFGDYWGREMEEDGNQGLLIRFNKAWVKFKSESNNCNLLPKLDGKMGRQYTNRHIVVNYSMAQGLLCWGSWGLPSWKLIAVIKEMLIHKHDGEHLASIVAIRGCTVNGQLELTIRLAEKLLEGTLDNIGIIWRSSFKFNQEEFCKTISFSLDEKLKKVDEFVNSWIYFNFNYYLRWTTIPQN